KSSIKAESTTVMVDIIQILNEYPNAKFTVEGHTDSVGSAKLNQTLSESRANSVRDFLIDKGIGSSRLSAIGYGEDKPIATNNTRSGRKQNRRVEINLVK
ncbi:MAG: OmpA family protein, partial [Maribacter sp.]|nr:OmpA family protein [Maribacter sp.]